MSDRSGFTYEEIETLARVFDGVAHPNRLATLLGIFHDRALDAIAADVPISEQGVRNHAERLVEDQLVYRPETDGLYAVTPIGRFVVLVLERVGESMVTAMRAVEAAEAEARSEVEGLPLTEGERERVVQRRTWAAVSDVLDEDLAFPELEEAPDDLN